MYPYEEMQAALRGDETAVAPSDLTDVLSTKRPPSFNEWFLSLPEGRQAALRDDKWMLAQAAFDAGMNLGAAYAIGG